MSNPLFIINIDVYDVCVVVSVNNPIDKVNRFIDKHFDIRTEFEPIPVNRAGSFQEDDDGVYLIQLEKLPIGIFMEGIFIHELNHCMFAILRRAKMVLNKGSEEAYTYLSAYLYREIMKKLFPNKKK